MKRGERRLRVPVGLVAAGALLVTSGIVAAIGTAGADSAGTGSVVAGCRPDLVIVLNDMLAQRRAQPKHAPLGPTGSAGSFTQAVDCINTGRTC